MAGQRPASSGLPHHPAMEADLRTASEAMQKAAEAMIAATESFRRQFHAREGEDDGTPLRPYTYHAVETARSSSGTAVRGSHPLVLPPMSPASGLGDVFSSPERPSVQTRRPSFGAQVVGGRMNGTGSNPQDSTPTLASPLARRDPPPVRGPAPKWQRHGTRSSSGHVDIVEAAERFKQGYTSTPSAEKQHHHPDPIPLQPRLQPHAPYQRPVIFQPPPAPSSSPQKDDEPSPIMQIGRYTYIRSGLDTTTSTEDFHTTLLTNQLRSPTHHHPLSRVHPSLHRSPSTRPKKPSSSSPPGLSLPREILFVLLICLSQVLMLAGISQALVPSTLIGLSFPDTTPGSIAWFSAAYGLTAGTFVLPAGRLGDLFGHKKIFVMGFVWFGVWSLAAGFGDMVGRTGRGGTVYFCLCRAMQGLGPALLVPNGQAMLGRTYGPGPRKNMVMSLFGAAAPLGFVVGAVMSSLFAQEVGWPWAFWCMAAVCLVLAAVAWLVIPASGATLTGDGGNQEKEGLWRRLDGPGIVLGVSGLVLFNFAFNQAPIVSWTTPYTYFILIIAVLLLAGFIYNELVAAHPLVPIAAMKAQTNFVLGCTAAGWGCFSIWVYYALAILQNVRHWSPLLSSAAFAHAPLSGFAASMLTAYLMGRRVKPHWIMFISMVAFFVGSIFLATAPMDQLYWYNTFFGILVMPFGMDMSNPAATIILSNSVPKEHQGIAASLVVTVVNYSISLALGFGGTVEVHANDGGMDLARGYQGAQYLSVGLGGLGVVLAAAFLMQSYGMEKKEREKGVR